MSVRIRVSGGGDDDFESLDGWLRDEPEFRGRVKALSAPIADTELGSAADVLEVAFGAGGMGTVLAASLRTWLQTRKSTVTITVTGAYGSITANLETAEKLGPLLDQILQPPSGPAPAPAPALESESESAAALEPESAAEPESAPELPPADDDES